ncbi:ATP-binding protein [Rhodoferax sp.]|uniref:ATP-binding protein n=1 Tax=Rhodoferax sp. TaxID=50421 RepID=UPI00263443E8|nr:ATP-binding protein [Rhodoferax sp.]MDD2808001.1 ATP-binding protein [Rhodoferax sp.]MDD4943002.1 ATP-binding protein [Rhodoferax sp.]
MKPLFFNANLAATAPPPRRVKAAFIWPFALVLALILGAFVAATYFLEVQVRDRALADRVQAVSKLVDQKLAKDTHLMQAVLRTMMGDQAIQSAFARMDRAALQRAAGPLFESLRRDHRITHLYFNGPDLVNLLRLHSPDEHGDQIQRATTLQARDTGQAAHGLELGALGTLTLRLVMPWQVGGRVLGYVEMGEEIGQLVDEIHDSLAVDVLVLIDKQFLPSQQWHHGLALLKRQGNWERFAQQVMVAKTAAQVPPGINDATLARLRGGRNDVMAVGARQLHLAMLALNDASGKRIGDLVVMRDISALQATFLTSMMTVTALGLIIGAVLLGFFYFALDRVERDYVRHSALELQLLRMGSEHQRMLQIEKLSALGTMVGEIAHQLNNPLVGVVNLAQLARRECHDPERTAELLQEIEHAGADCHAFIQSMLRFSKVSGFESRATPMKQVIDETVLLFQQTVHRPLPVQVVLPEQAVVLELDPILLRHALFNLLLNAAQATPGEGVIDIGLQAATQPQGTTPGWLLTVRDHGRGIAPDVLDKIFEPFFTTRSDGTGLGLPVVQHVALIHGGSVSVSCPADGGTQFAVWLPQEPQGGKRNTPQDPNHAA